MNEDINIIYRKYFDIIDSYFGSIKHHLGKHEHSHIDLGTQMANYPLISDLIIDSIGDLDDEIDTFWKNHINHVFTYLATQSSLKCLYSGDVSPVILENFVKRSALYIDTVILPDPLFNLVLIQKQIIGDYKYYLNKLIRHVFNIWKMKDVILADTMHKMVVIVPINLDIMSDIDRDTLLNNADNAFIEYINRVFRQSFVSTEECFALLDKCRDSVDIMSIVHDSTALPREFRTTEGLGHFLNRFSESRKYVKTVPHESTTGFPLYLQSQFIRAYEHKHFCTRLRAEPIYDYDLPWFFFTYEMGGLDMDAAIANALHKDGLQWIGSKNIPISAIQEMRLENRLDYMRSILRKGMTDLKARDDSELIVTATQLEQNLRDAFKRQASEVKSLKKEVFKISKVDIPILVSGCLAGFIPFVGNAISIAFAGRDLQNLRKARGQIKQQIKEKEHSFINLLMATYEDQG